MLASRLPTRSTGSLYFSLTLILVLIYYVITLQQARPILTWQYPCGQNQPHSETKVDNTDSNFVNHIFPTDHLIEQEITLLDGTVRFTRYIPGSQPGLVIIVLTKDDTSWGGDRDQAPRTVHDFLTLLEATKLDLNNTSLAISTESKDQYHDIRQAIVDSHIPFPHLTILLAPPYGDEDSRAGRKNRDPAYQKHRRSRVAQLRNRVMARSLHDEQHIIWLDADVKYITAGTIQTMLRHSHTNISAGIMTVRCAEGPNNDYDANAWGGGGRPAPANIPGTLSSDAQIAEEEDKIVQLRVPALQKGSTDDDLLPLDSVGGTLLYMRSELVLSGLQFSPGFVIGTRWGRDGWDGIETEGLCYVARDLGPGGKCWVLGGRHHVEHTHR